MLNTQHRTFTKKVTMPPVSVIATVYNEGESIRRLLDSLVGQTRFPDEVVICDGGSRDETVAVIETYRGRLPNLNIIVAPGANISRGRNLAIAAAAGPIIASTDAGVRLDPEWLEELVAPFEKATDDGRPTDDRRPTTDDGVRLTHHASRITPHASRLTPHAVAGFFVADVQGIFQTAMAATVLPLVDEIDPQRFLPSSRSVAFTKEAWQQAGGYPEWLDYCEDLIFDLRVNELAPAQSTAFAWAPRAVAYFQPRTSLRSFWPQYFRYARGDGKADLWRKRHLVRYATYLILLPALLGHAQWGFSARWLGWAGLLAGMIAYCARPWQRLGSLGRDLSPGAQLQAAALVPLIRVVGDVAKMAGYPVGLLWRWRNRHRKEIWWKK
jgi:glycosyltransferase involved in cell wall biosynthesis